MAQCGGGGGGGQNSLGERLGGRGDPKVFPTLSVSPCLYSFPPPLQVLIMATTGNGGGKGVVGSGGGGGGGGGEIRGNLKRFASREVKMMDPHILANELHMAEETYLLLDCRPILAYNSCHITGGWGFMQEKNKKI